MSDDVEAVLQRFADVMKPTTETGGEVQNLFESFGAIRKAPTTSEALALATVRQEKGLNRLNSSITDLVSSSNKLYTLSLVLTWLTGILAFLTLALVGLTYTLTFPG